MAHIEQSVAVSANKLSMPYSLEGRRLDPLVQALPFAILMVDREESVRLVNRSCTRLVQRRIETPIAVARLREALPLYVGDSDVPYSDQLELVRRALRGEASWVDGVSLERPDRRVFLEGWVGPVIDDDGYIEGAVILLSDRDARSSMQREFRKLMRDAEDGSREEFDDERQKLASASHEIRSPLGAIVGHARYLREHASLDAECRRRLDYILECGEHVTAVVHDMLDLAHSESDSDPLAVSCLDLRRSLGWLEELYRDESETVAFRMDIDENVPTKFCCDQAKLRQILINLLNNAFKMTDEGSVCLHVARDTAADQLCFTVTDTGVGMREETMRRMFQAYVQGQSGMRRGGTGLGLSIANNLTRRLGGSLDAESAPGHGSRFILRLPLETVDADTRPAVEAVRGHSVPPALHQALSTLQENLKEQLHKAATRCDPDEVLALCQAIEAHQPALSSHLRELAQSFAFGELVNLVADRHAAEPAR